MIDRSVFYDTLNKIGKFVPFCNRRAGVEYML